MTDTALLNLYIRKSGLKKGYLARALCIPPASFSRKINNEREFLPTEIIILCKMLGIKSLKERDMIFFAEKVAKTATD